MSAAERPAIHSGNYYTSGVVRVLAKLSEMGIAVPQEALGVPKHHGFGKPLVEFTWLEHAILDWFEGRDYDQAQALIHYRPPCAEWQVIRVLDDEKCPRELSHGMLCPSAAAALAVVLYSCDADSVRLDSCRQENDVLIVTIGGNDALQIEPVTLEPFDRAVRDRVRTAFKGVRRRDPAMTAHAVRLPGFDRCFDNAMESRAVSASEGCLILGFPGNWALAMRNALKQVGISVKQHQAQELAAVFFGASNWHQLVRHQDEINDDCEPVALAYDTSEGRQERFYRTPEEAIFALGHVLNRYPETVVCVHFDLTLDCRRVLFLANRQRDLEAAKRAGTYCFENCIECASNDYWDPEIHGAPAFTEGAQRLLADVASAPQYSSSAHGLLYERNDAAGLLEAKLKRMGLPAGNLVYFGDHHAAAVFHEEEPDGGPLLTAFVQFYRFEDGNPKHIADVAMYKADVFADEMDGGFRLSVHPDYARGDPIEIQSTDAEPIRRFLDLTFVDTFFNYSTPQIAAGLQWRH